MAGLTAYHILHAMMKAAGYHSFRKNPLNSCWEEDIEIDMVQFKKEIQVHSKDKTITADSKTLPASHFFIPLFEVSDAFKEFYEVKPNSDTSAAYDLSSYPVPHDDTQIDVKKFTKALDEMGMNIY